MQITVFKKVILQNNAKCHKYSYKVEETFGKTFNWNNLQMIDLKTKLIVYAMSFYHTQNIILNRSFIYHC